MPRDKRLETAVAEALWREEARDIRAAHAVRQREKWSNVNENVQQKYLKLARAAIRAQHQYAHELDELTSF